jgi:hypothetical protein
MTGQTLIRHFINIKPVDARSAIILVLTETFFAHLTALYANVLKLVRTIRTSSQTGRTV